MDPALNATSLSCNTRMRLQKVTGFNLQILVLKTHTNVTEMLFPVLAVENGEAVLYPHIS